jgi:hypothetical protein
VRFEVIHEFDIPLDALELAVMSPDLADKFSAKAQELGVGIERVTERERSLRGGVLERRWHYQANVNVPKFAHGYVTREMCAWEEQTVYDMERHRGAWTVSPNVKPEWRRFFDSNGTYEVDALPGGRSRRTIRGELQLRVRLVRQMAERLIVNQVKKAFSAEAATLQDMATLA